MPIKICPNCKKRYIVDNHVGDYIHDCSQTDVSDAIKQEDILVIGNWEDYSGSGTKSKQEVMRQGNHNELQGTRADIMQDKDKEVLTKRGLRASTRRQRVHLEYIKQ